MGLAHVYRPGKTILKLYLMPWTHSPCLETIEYNHMLYVLWGNNKNKPQLQFVSSVLGCVAKASEEVGIGCVAPHATSVF